MRIENILYLVELALSLSVIYQFCKDNIFLVKSIVITEKILLKILTVLNLLTFYLVLKKIAVL